MGITKIFVYRVSGIFLHANTIKKITMKSLIVVLALLGLGTLANAQKKPKIKGNKEVTEVVRKIDGTFNIIEVDDGLEVTLFQGNENNYVLKVDNNLIDVIDFSVFDNTLRIYTLFKITAKKKLDIQLTVRDVEQLILKNGAKVTSKKNIEAAKFYLTGYNSSRFDLNVKSDDVTVILHRNAGGKINIESDNATLVMNDRTDMKAYLVTDKLRVTLNASAELDTNGNVDDAYISLKGSSKFNARKMKISVADLYTSNSSDVYVNVNKNLELYAQGSSKIYVYGDPKIEIKGLTDKSKIIKK